MRNLKLATLALALAFLPAESGWAQDDTTTTVTPPAASEADSSAADGPGSAIDDARKALESAGSRENVSSSIQVMVLLTVLSLAPSILVMMTSFTRIIIVLGLLRQAMATQQLPPNQVLIGLALFMTFVVMAPVYNQVQQDAIGPYMDGELAQSAAIDAAASHMRTFMIRQIESGDNTDDVYLFLDGELAERSDLKWGDVPTMTLIPAYMVSELKIAFLMGFRIYLPFLIIDMVIASILISMGMLMLPPVLISLPFKLLLFVLADGWRLVVGTLMTSFG